jgi:transposase
MSSGRGWNRCCLCPRGRVGRQRGRNGSSSTGSGGGWVGAPWRDVPDCYGSWRAVYALFRRWQRAGAWAQIVTALQTRADAAGLITWDVSVDSTIARAHQHAAGARRHPSQQQEPPGGLSIEPDALGRSRGGLTTKIHLACEQGPEGAVPDPDRRAAR